MKIASDAKTNSCLAKALAYAAEKIGMTGQRQALITTKQLDFFITL